MPALERKLPVLRPDLELLPGPPDADGSPTAVLHDPLRSTFDKANWWQIELLCRLRHPVTLEALAARLSAATTARVGPERIEAFCRDLDAKGLTRASAVRSPETLERSARAREMHPLRWLLAHYLYLRVPLVHPDRFLGRTLPAMRTLIAWPVLALLVAIAALGLFALVQNFEQYLTTFPRFFTPAGALAYLVALSAVKGVHELGHAYAAKARGCRVPTMGVAFMVFFPVPYSDVTDTWRLRDRAERLWVSLGGVLVELAIAGVALFGWAVTRPGLAHSLCFVLSSSTLLASLLVNLNPGMRFDGYYLLSDLLGIDNLQARAFAFTRWVYRRALLGLDAPDPEPGLPAGRRKALVVYTLYAWTYRFFLYLGIAVLVYHAFAKILGVVLLAMQLYSFLVKPVAREIRSLARMRNALRLDLSGGLALVVLLVLLLWALLPLPRTRSVPAITVASREQVLYAPFAGRVAALHVTRGQIVHAGQPLADLTSKALAHDLALLRAQIEEARERLRALARVRAGRDRLPEAHRELDRLQARCARLEQEAARGTIRAAHDGRVIEWREELRPGLHVPARAALGRIAATDTPRVRAYVPESVLADVRPGGRVRFASFAHARPCEAVIESIDSAPTARLRDPALGSAAGGAIAVRPEETGHLILVDTYYVMEVGLVQEGHHDLGETGRVWFSTGARSLVVDWAQRLYQLLLGESAF